MKRLVFLMGLAMVMAGCGKENVEVSRPDEEFSSSVDLDQLASVFSDLPLGLDQVREVHDAVSHSSGNGYDEEYLMKDLLEEPGRGVGEQKIRSLRMKSGDASMMACPSGGTYSQPLREMLEAYLEEQHEKGFTRSSPLSPEEYLNLLSRSQTQIYWPYSERWDGRTMPVITFDPENGSSSNNGYVLVEEEGKRKVKEVVVTEKMAQERPVWVMNRNDDCEFTSIEIHRQSDPDWGMGGGSITITPDGKSREISNPDDPELKTLFIKDFTALRNYDSWFGGASEFFIKSGSVEEFTASTEAELQLFNPIITDFMVVVRRDEVGVKKPLNTVLVSDMSPQLVNSAFMMIEDDGGKQTKWECEAVVKIKSKSYGFIVSIPYNSHDDIVWRGSLSTKYFWHRNNVTETFGDVQLTFQIIQ